MKLYAKVSSERASKGQGGNTELSFSLMVGSAKDSRQIALLKLIRLTDGSYELLYRNTDSDSIGKIETATLQKGSIEKRQ